MIRKLYKYTGSISSFSYRRNSPEAVPVVDMILGDINDDDKAPIRISAAGGLADYINAIEWTDAEERYQQVKQPAPEVTRAERTPPWPRPRPPQDTRSTTTERWKNGTWNTTAARSSISARLRAPSGTVA